jgi:protein ImuB
VAREFSPRIEIAGPLEILLDLNGLARLFGDARVIAEELRRTAADRGIRVRVAIAGTRTAARLLVRHRAGLTIVEPGDEAGTLAPLPLALAAGIAPAPADSTITSDDLLSTLRRWGLRTLGELALLPADEVVSRLGHDGLVWHRLARGEDARPLVPSLSGERFEQAVDLEWPIDGLEPLSFVLGRLLEPLSAHLARRDRGAAVLHVRLRLVTRTVHARSLQLPVPMRDPRALRTLLLLDLESHPPDAAIDHVVVAVDPTPGRVVQFSLLTRPQPSAEQVSTLMARLGALMGEGRCGSPAPVDTWRPGAFEMMPFTPPDDAVPIVEPSRVPLVALRRFRHPIPARVDVNGGAPSRVTTDRRELAGGHVRACAGPWRTSGDWWTTSGQTGRAGPDLHPSAQQPRAGDPGGRTRRETNGTSWDRDEWDVTLEDGITYRIFRDRTATHQTAMRSLNNEDRMAVPARGARPEDTANQPGGLRSIKRRPTGWFVDGVVD